MDNINYNPDGNSLVDGNKDFFDKLEAKGTTNTENSIDANNADDKRDIETNSATEPLYNKTPTILRQISRNISTQSVLLDTVKQWAGLCVGGLAIILLICSWTSHNRYT